MMKLDFLILNREDLLPEYRSLSLQYVEVRHLLPFVREEVPKFTFALITFRGVLTGNTRYRTIAGKPPKEFCENLCKLINNNSYNNPF